MAASQPANIRCFSAAAELNAALGAYIASISSAAIAARGIFTLATSGGSLPKNLGDALQLVVESGKDLQTEKWHVFYVDERVVALDHADSNHAATKAAFYNRPFCKIPAEKIHTIEAHAETPIACAKQYETQVRAVVGGGGSLVGAVPTFDLILLGMGPDGHTASLFPGHPLVTDTSSRLVAEITDSPKPPPIRVTFTYTLINQSYNVAFVALGESKAEVVAHIFNESIPAEERLPAARVRQAGGSELPVWFMDAPACSKLPQA